MNAESAVYREQRARPVDEGYRPFPNVAWRNALQESLEVSTLVRLLNLPLHKRILEVGCGRGIAIPAIYRLCRPVRLVGLDIDGELITEAENRLMTRGVAAELYNADVRDIPFPDSSFDVVIDFGTCYQIRRPEMALREIARVLTVGGLFVHETPISQLLAHPTRASGCALPWRAAPHLAPYRTALLWSSRKKTRPSF